MKALLLQLVRALADHPREVSVTEVAGSQTLICEVRCHSDDVGKIIGRNGRTIQALRVLVEALGMRRRQRVILELAE